jgi:CHRD domain
MRTLATAMLGALAAATLSLASRADTVRFTAQLASESDNAPTPNSGRGSVVVTLATATKTAQWTIEYSGLAGIAQDVSCGALDASSGPAVRLTSNLASPITGSKALSDPEIASLGSGRWVCVITSDRDEAELGGVLQPAR